MIQMTQASICSRAYRPSGRRGAPRLSATSARAKSSASNGRRSSSCSPMPISLTGMPELARDRERDAALRGAVELGQHDARRRRPPRAKSLAWRRPFWPGRRVDRQQRLVRRVRRAACAITRRTLVSSAIRSSCVCRRPAVSTITTSAPSARAARDRVEGDRARVGARRALDDLAAGALRPLLELLDRRGAEGVGGAEHDRAARAPGAGARRACRSSSSCRCR